MGGCCWSGFRLPTLKTPASRCGLFVFGCGNATPYIILLMEFYAKTTHPMPRSDVTSDLERYGPGRQTLPPTEVQARAYCRRLARMHYENFTVASWLLPRWLRQHFANVYAYCRWADDLADETGDAEKSLELLDWWEGELRACYDGRTRHPVFVALRDTIVTFDVPMDPLLELLTAFRQDQHKRRYETFDELAGYCRNSANPVGHLVLYLGRCFGERTSELSDSICTGLQLTNFWQDVARDFDGGRVYLPQESMRRFGYNEAMLARGETNDAFRDLMAFEVDRAERFLREGFPLVPLVPREMRIDVELFIRGGLAILAAIRRIDYHVLARRPTLGRFAKLRLLTSAWWSGRTSHARGGAP